MATTPRIEGYIVVIDAILKGIGDEVIGRIVNGAV